MGISIARLLNGLFGKRDMRILMVGLDAAGNTTVLFKLKLSEVVTTIPTIGMLAKGQPPRWQLQRRQRRGASSPPPSRLMLTARAPGRLGFNVETVEYKGIVFTVWDVGGQDRIRPLWRHYFQNTQGTDRRHHGPSLTHPHRPGTP